jgi:predicted flap endonuclease-1-like 5' DNA nuclease
MGMIIGGVALLLLVGLVLGLIIAWFFGAGPTAMSLFVGVLLVVAGAVVGFVVEWVIDEAYRRNRELRRQLGQRSESALSLGANVGGDDQSDDTSAETLADFLRQRDRELQELRDQLAAHDGQMDALRTEFDAYQRTHPDDLTVIKGIGPVYQWKLRDTGFNTYQQLATADPDQLRRMLDVKNWQRVNVESWIEQARDWAQRGR